MAVCIKSLFPKLNYICTYIKHFKHWRNNDYIYLHGVKFFFFFNHILRGKQTIKGKITTFYIFSQKLSSQQHQTDTCHRCRSVLFHSHIKALVALGLKRNGILFNYNWIKCTHKQKYSGVNQKYLSSLHICKSHLQQRRGIFWALGLPRCRCISDEHNKFKACVKTGWTTIWQGVPHFFFYPQSTTHIISTPLQDRRPGQKTQ